MTEIYSLTPAEFYQRIKKIFTYAGLVADDASRHFELDDTGRAICFSLAHKILFDAATIGTPSIDEAAEKYLDEYLYDVLIPEFAPEFSPTFADNLIGACQLIVGGIVAILNADNHARQKQERYNSLTAEFDEIKAKLRRQSGHA